MSTAAVHAFTITNKTKLGQITSPHLHRLSTVVFPLYFRSTNLLDLGADILDGSHSSLAAGAISPIYPSSCSSSNISLIILL